jgi:hypothetical protein
MFLHASFSMFILGHIVGHYSHIALWSTGCFIASPDQISGLPDFLIYDFEKCNFFLSDNPLLRPFHYVHSSA